MQDEGKRFGMRASLGAAMVSILLTLPHVASASLIYDSTIAVTAQGFGNVPRDVTMQLTGRDTTGRESGCVSATGGVFAGGSASCISDVLVHDGNSITNAGGNEVNPLADNNKFGIPTLSSLGIIDPSQIQILFNPDEPGGDSANVIDLTLKFYDGVGLVAAIDGSHNFASTDPGNGSAGFVFVIDSAERTWLRNNVFNLQNFGSFHLALEATITDIAGGPESFVILADDAPPTRVPEPGTLPLFAVGIIGMWLALRRQRRQHA